MPSFRVTAYLVVAAVFGTVMLAAPASAAEEWRDALHETKQLLSSGKFSEARDRLSTITRAMADHISTPSDTDRLFASALAQLAVAEAGIGNADDAVWLWHIAQNVHEDARAFDPSPYGESAKLLAGKALPEPPQKCAQPGNAPAPAVVKRSEPKYPKRARQVPIVGLVIVEMELDAEGRPRTPQVLRSPSAALTYSTLMTLREWRFTAPQDAADPVVRFCRMFSFGHHK